MTDLAAPLELAHGAAWRNRIALAPMTNRQSHHDGVLGENEFRWLTRRAWGGFGMVTTCAAHVAMNGQAWPGQLGIWSDDHLPGLTRLATALSEAGARSVVQLHHGGLRVDPTVVDDIVGPWADSSVGGRAMSTTEIHVLVEDFVRSAVRAEQAGFDGIEIHGGHGYIVSQFLDAEHNHRSDGYGGDLHGRARFLREIVEGIRRHTAPHLQVGVRISPERWGMELPDALVLAEFLMGSGLVDYLDMSLWDVAKTPNNPHHGPAKLIDQVAALERGQARLGVAGKIRSAATAQECLDRGADFVLIGLAAILHHDFASRALADPDFTAVAMPVSPDYLMGESVSPSFIEYLVEGRPGLVAVD